MFAQTVTRAFSRLGLDQRGTDPCPRQPTPMLLQKADAMFSSPDWTYEPKWDGFRIIATIREGSTRLLSRNGHSFTKLFGPISDSLRGFPVSILLDGEVIVINDKGKPDFEGLQQRLRPRDGKLPGLLCYMVFDCLYEIVLKPTPEGLKAQLQGNVRGLLSFDEQAPVFLRMVAGGGFSSYRKGRSCSHESTSSRHCCSVCNSRGVEREGLTVAENSGITAERRGRPFRPGQSGNPGGRPKEAVHVRELARQHTEEAVEILTTIMRRGRTEAARVRAAEALLARGWGQPGRPMDTSTDREPLRITMKYADRAAQHEHRR